MFVSPLHKGFVRFIRVRRMRNARSSTTTPLETPKMKNLLSCLVLLLYPVNAQVLSKDNKNAFFDWASEIFSSHDQTTKEQACICGLQGNKIVGGVETKRHEYPWMAAMFYNDNFRCGASLVNDRFVVTAAHCVHRLNPENFVIYLGAHDLSSRERGRIKVAIKDILTHPEYNTRTHVNDIALMEFTKPVRFCETILPVCLPSSAGTSYRNKTVTVLGWGRTQEGGPVTKILRKVDVPIVSHEACQEAYGEFSIDCQRMICAGEEEGGKDSCQGDSGGPLLMKEEFHQVLVGVVSFGEGCARPGKPGVYARVDAFIPFILNNTEEALYCPAYRGRSTRLVTDFTGINEFRRRRN